ncbi:hypothetical protein [Komagataeibacter sp. FXV3]|nr:hypothetical protein [Komagataeibacter sp. FXV3]
MGSNPTLSATASRVVFNPFENLFHNASLPEPVGFFRAHMRHAAGQAGGA